MQSVSGTDLVVGARGSEMQLVLYAIFHLGSVSNNLSGESWLSLASDPRVAWTIPVSLGDSHRDYPVVATNTAFYEHFRYRGGKALALAQGHKVNEHLEVVLGSEVAKSLGYQLGHELVLTHGKSGHGQHEHKDHPFKVVGILAATGTPVDRALYIDLEAMAALHKPHEHHEHHAGRDLEHNSGEKVDHEHNHVSASSKQDLHHVAPSPVTAVLVGLKKRSQVLTLQRELNEEKREALTAAMPAVVMNQIWDVVGIVEQALLLVSTLVTCVGLVGLAAAILAGLGERRRELAILRSAGASPLDILLLLTFEGILLVCSGILVGFLSLYGLLFMVGPWLAEHFGLVLGVAAPSSGEWLIVLGIVLAGLCSSLIPAYRAYRLSLADGLTVAL